MPYRQELEFRLIVGVDAAGTVSYDLKLVSAPKLFPETIPLAYGNQIDYPKYLVGKEIGEEIDREVEELKLAMGTEIKRKWEKEVEANFCAVLHDEDNVI